MHDATLLGTRSGPGLSATLHRTPRGGAGCRITERAHHRVLGHQPPEPRYTPARIPMSMSGRGECHSTATGTPLPLHPQRRIHRPGTCVSTPGCGNSAVDADGSSLAALAGSAGRMGTECCSDRRRSADRSSGDDTADLSCSEAAHSKTAAALDSAGPTMHSTGGVSLPSCRFLGGRNDSITRTACEADAATAGGAGEGASCCGCWGTAAGALGIRIAAGAVTVASALGTGTAAGAVGTGGGGFLETEAAGSGRTAVAGSGAGAGGALAAALRSLMGGFSTCVRDAGAASGCLGARAGGLPAGCLLAAAGELDAARCGLTSGTDASVSALLPLRSDSERDASASPPAGESSALLTRFRCDGTGAQSSHGQNHSPS
eukprot:scaffold21802_cov132-Isochrysis_galbana.AAC.4